MESLALPPHAARIFTLPNGLELIVEEDHSAPVASIQAWVKTGSIHEGRWLGAGLSHFLEHLAFKGTPTHGAQDFARMVQDHGGYLNAYTSFDRTVYWIDVPSRGASAALELLSDALMNSLIPEDEVGKEQEVIRREFAMGFDDPDNVAGKQLFATAFASHPMRHPVIGHLENFNQLTRADVVEYYQTRYAPNNMFLLIVGDVDADAIHEQVAKFYEKYPRKMLPDVFLPDEPAQMGRREMHAEFPTELTRLALAWHVPAITHPDLPALDVLASILGSGRSSRLYRHLREPGLVHSADAWCYTPAGAGLFGLDMMLDPEKKSKVQDAAMDEMSKIQNDGVTEFELQKARRQFLSHQFNAMTSMRGKATDLGSNWLYSRSLSFTHDYLAAVQRLSPDEIQRVARTYFTETNLTISSLNPQSAKTESARAIRQASATEIQRFELSNGLRLLVREDDRLPLVSMVASFAGGLLAETEDNNGISRLFARTLLKGTALRTAAEISAEIEAVGGGIGSDSGNNSMTTSVKVLQPDLAMGINLLADVLLNATFPDPAITREKEVMFASIKADDEEITSQARNLLRAKLFGAHPFALRNLGRVESIQNLQRRDLVKFSEKILCAKNGVLAVFGAVKAKEVLALVEEAFGKMRSGAPAFESIPQPAAFSECAVVNGRMPKTQAVLMIGFPGVDLYSSDRHALDLIDESCSDLGSRLFVRIREEMGLAYFVGSSQLAGLAKGAFTFYVGTDPAKVIEVQAALNDEIKKLAEGGLTAEELSRAKEKFLGAQEIRNQNNDALAHSCALDELYGIGYANYLKLRKEIEAITAEQVAEVAKRYFSKASVTAIVSPN